jgi:CBS domain-containing protein
MDLNKGGTLINFPSNFIFGKVMEVIKDFRRIFPPVMDRAYDRSKERRLVSDIMSVEVVAIEPDASMGEAAKFMGERRIGSLIVAENGKPIGIVTERDLLSDILAKDLSPNEVLVRSSMSYPLITINSSATIKEAAQMMMEKKGRLAVFQEDNLVGVVTASDLIKSMPWVEETRIDVDEYMTKKVETSDEKVTVAIVTKIMGEKRIGSVVVTRDEKPEGIFTERDLLTTFLAKGRTLLVPVGEACSSPIYAIPSKTPVNVAAYIMSSRHMKRLPVVEKDVMIGIITARDLVEAYAQ